MKHIEKDKVTHWVEVNKSYTLQWFTILNAACKSDVPKLYVNMRAKSNC